MNRQLKKRLKQLQPLWIKNIRWKIRLRSIENKQKEIRDYFLSLDKAGQVEEVKSVISFFENNSFSAFPYEFTKKYNLCDVEVHDDPSCRMKYVVHKGKKLYFPADFPKEQIGEKYNELLIEQDENSPHRYETPEFRVKEGDVIADIGAAEGIWALENANAAGKIYLFECEEDWICALQKTFEPWKEKVVIVNKYVSDITQGDNITLDDFVENRGINFIKADVEGAEISLLKGAEKLLATQKDLKIILCAYHRQQDEKDLMEFLGEKGYTAQPSQGYMLFILDKNLSVPYLRRGVIRASKPASLAGQ